MKTKVKSNEITLDAALLILCKAQVEVQFCHDEKDIVTAFVIGEDGASLLLVQGSVLRGQVIIDLGTKLKAWLVENNTDGVY